MCSPAVAKLVRERIEKEGKPHFSRRDFLRVGGIAATSIMALPLLGNTVAAQTEPTLTSFSEIIDLTHVFSTTVPTYLLGEQPRREDFVTIENDGFYIQRWTFTEHAGTHVDIPAHFMTDGTTVDDYPPELLTGPAVVIDISAKAATNADSALEVDDIESWERINGEIPAGAIVLLYSGWDVYWNDPIDFRNADADDVQHYPGFSAEAATFLIEQRNIKAIGVDTLSLDVGTSATFDVHVAILSAGKYGLEGVANLAAIKDRSATVVVGVPRWESGSGGPARLLALV
jgi:kynurenine formamidase